MNEYSLAKVQYIYLLIIDIILLLSTEIVLKKIKNPIIRR